MLWVASLFLMEKVIWESASILRMPLTLTKSKSEVSSLRVTPPVHQIQGTWSSVGPNEVPSFKEIPAVQSCVVPVVRFDVVTLPITRARVKPFRSLTPRGIDKFVLLVATGPKVVMPSLEFSH